MASWTGHLLAVGEQWTHCQMQVCVQGCTAAGIACGTVGWQMQSCPMQVIDAVAVICRQHVEASIMG